MPEILERLGQTYPGTAAELCALEHGDAFQLLVATVLSAQCTDVRVNMVTPALFARYPDPASLAGAARPELEECIRSTGFFRAKAGNLIGLARALLERFGGEVPTDLDDLVTLPGVGRKTANVVRSVAFGLPGLPVDTHVGRLARRLGLTDSADPAMVERDLDRLVRPEERGACSLRLILHGRAVCTARAPRCDACFLADLCPTAPTGRSGPAGRDATVGRATAASATHDPRPSRSSATTRGATSLGGRLPPRRAGSKGAGAGPDEQGVPRRSDRDPRAGPSTGRVRPGPSEGPAVPS